MPATFTHFVFVDFENVPKVDLALLADKPAHVTLLIGQKQTKIDTTLSVQLNEFAAQVTPVLVAASGRNALDMILAGYLGQAVERHKDADFHIVSQDKDFDPLVAHLNAKGVRVARHASFAGLPFVTARKKIPTKPPFLVAPATVATKATSSPKPKTPTDKYLKLREQIKSGKNRPGTRAKLMHHIHTLYGQKSTPEQLTAVIENLLAGGVIAINEQDKVTYL